MKMEDCEGIFPATNRNSWVKQMILLTSLFTTFLNLGIKSKTILPLSHVHPRVGSQPTVRRREVIYTWVNFSVSIFWGIQKFGVWLLMNMVTIGRVISLGRCLKINILIPQTALMWLQRSSWVSYTELKQNQQAAPIHMLQELLIAELMSIMCTMHSIVDKHCRKQLFFGSCLLAHLRIV